MKNLLGRFILITIISLVTRNLEAQHTLNGAIISLPDSSEDEVELLAGGSTGREDSVKSLRNNIIIPGDQGLQLSCVGWALGYCVLSYNKHLFNNWSYYKSGSQLDYKHIISPSFIYNHFKGGSDCSEGIDTRKALQLAQTIGVPSWQSQPYNVNQCKRLIGSDYANPIARILSFNTLYNNDPKKLNGAPKPSLVLKTIRQQIALGKPVLLTISVDNTFDKASNHNWANPDKPFIWNYALNDFDYMSNFHSVACIGYDLKSGLYEIINSWGTQWGNEGFCWITEEMMQKVVWQAFSTENSPDYIVSNNDQMIEVGSTKFKESTGDTLNFVQLNKKDFFNLNGYSISREDASKKSNYAIISIADTAKTDSAISTFLIKAGEYRLLKINNNLINIKGLDIDKKSGRLYLALTVEKNQQVKDYKIEF